MKTSILLADDHAIVREGLKRLIEAQPDMQVVGEAADGEQAVERAGKLKPDILIVDLSMPGFGGGEVTTRVHEAWPAIRVLALTVHEDPGYLQALLAAGANGYVLKRAAADELVRAIRAIREGGSYIDPRMSAKLESKNGKFLSKYPSASAISDREREVLQRSAQGFSNKEIAAQLDVSVKTVETYKARAMEKLGMRSRVDIVRFAAENGWLQQPDADAAISN